MARLKPTPADPSPLRPSAARRKPLVRRRLVVETPQTVLLLVAVVSVLLHVVLGAATYRQSLGRLDMEAMQDARPPLRVRQASFDMNFDPLARPGDAAAERDAGPTVAEVSQALLAEADETPGSETIEQDLALREYDEPRPEPDLDTFAAETSDFDMPADLWQSLEGDTPADLAYQPGEGDGAGAGTPGNGDGPGGDGAREAQRLLADAGLLGMPAGGGGGDGDGGGAGVGLPETPGPRVESSATLDARLLDMPLVAPDIDFAGMALDATTRLHIPEHLDHDFDYFVTRFPGRASEQGYFRVDIVPRQSLRKLTTMPKDVIFLLDLSGSTAQRWAGELAGGVRQSLSTLHETDRFNIVLLADQVAFFSGRGPLQATRDNLDDARDFLDAIEPARRPLARIAGARSAPRLRRRMLYHIPEGRADLEAALSRLLVRDVDAGRVYNLVLVSEGKPTDGVIEPRELINLITRDNAGLASIYAVGIGDNVDRTLLEFLAYRNRGDYRYAPDRGDVATTIRTLASRIRYPLVRDVQLHVAGSQVEQVHPVNLPNIHQGVRLSIYGRYNQLAPFTMRVTGNNAGQPVDFTFARDLNLAPEANRDLARHWAFWKLHHLYSEIIRQGEQPALLRQINQLRQQYDLQTMY
ncbi:MAG: hypothetical protein WD151_05680 [Phycisphaeraceae bacterium]